LKPPKGTFTFAYVGAQLDPAFFNLWNQETVKISSAEGASVGPLKYCHVQLTTDSDEDTITKALDFYFEYDGWAQNIQAYGCVVLMGSRKVKDIIKNAKEAGTSWSWRMEDFIAACNGQAGL
jgi:hypothetical protein